MLTAASLGLGWWSHELAKSIQGTSDKIRIAGCHSRSAEKRKAFADAFGCGTHESYEAILADPAIEAVIITTPHSQHAEHVTAAARAGKHVFVEKPFTLTPESGAAAAGACREAGVVLAVGHNRRFSPVLVELIRMRDAGEFGKVLHIETNFSAPSATRWSSAHWRSNRKESPAGGLAGLGVHMIDVFTAIGGRAVTTVALAKRQVLEIDTDDTTSALCELESGATAYLGTVTASPFSVIVNVYGTKASAFSHLDREELLVLPAGGEAARRPLEKGNTLKAELEEFADACAGRTIYRVKPEEAIHTVAVMQAIAASAAANGARTKID